MKIVFGGEGGGCREKHFRRKCSMCFVETVSLFSLVLLFCYYCCVLEYVINSGWYEVYLVRWISFFFVFFYYLYFVIGHINVKCNIYREIVGLVMCNGWLLNYRRKENFWNGWWHTNMKLISRELQLREHVERVDMKLKNVLKHMLVYV